MIPYAQVEGTTSNRLTSIGSAVSNVRNDYCLASALAHHSVELHNRQLTSNNSDVMFKEGLILVRAV